MHDHGTVKFKLGGTSAQFKPARPMADLTEYEQDLLRRNALLEERAAASIARAKAVVEGSAVDGRARGFGFGLALPPRRLL